MPDYPKGINKGESYLEDDGVADVDMLLKPRAVEHREEDADGPPHAAAEHLWTFSCELSTGRSISILAWNKKNMVT